MQVRTILLTGIMLIMISCSPSESMKPNIILISLDTMRQDHMGCSGYYRNTTPTLDSLARSGVMFNRCQAQSPRTLPSHASMFTGLSVVSHGTGVFGDCTFDENLPSIQQTLRDNGFITAGFTNVIYLSEIYEFDKHFDYLQCAIKDYYNGAQTLEDARSWIEDNRTESHPFFLFIHIFEIHEPYDPPEPYDILFTSNGSEGITKWELSDRGELLNPEDRDHLLNLYDGEIAYVDNLLSGFFSYLTVAGLADSTLIIVVSDHGEEFLEHDGWGHAHSLYQELLHVPLIISGPGIPAGVVDSASAAQLDLFPTILDYLNIPVPESVEGVSLLSESLRIGRSLPSSGLDSQLPGFGEGNTDVWYRVSILNGHRKLQMDMKTGEVSMYDLQLDPGEHQSIEADSNLIIDAEIYWTTIPQGHPSPVDTLKSNAILRDLGYIR